MPDAWARRPNRSLERLVDLSPDLSTGTVEATITSPNFEVPTTVARFGDRLAAVNAKFDTGFPPTADTYEVVVVRLRE